MIKKLPIDIYLKTTNKVDANHTVDIKGGLLNQSTLDSKLSETTTSAGNFTTNVYKGGVVTNKKNILFTKKFVAATSKFYQNAPDFTIRSSNASNYLVETSSDNTIITVKGTIGTYAANGSLGASNKVKVETTEGIIVGMVVATQNNTTLADTNYVRVTSIDGPKQLTLSSSSFSSAVNTVLHFKNSSSDNKVFVKTFTVSYIGNKGTTISDNDEIFFTHLTASLPGAYVGVTPVAKVINDISINTSDISHNGEQRTVIVTGSVGSVFNLTITKLGEAAGSSSVTDTTYNFTSDTFTTSTTTLSNQTIGSTGVYSKVITFPAATTLDTYQFLITAGSGTSLNAKVFGDTPSTPTFSILQKAKVTVTVSLASSENASSYNNSGSNYGVTNITSDGIPNTFGSDEFLIQWTVSTTNVAGNAINIIRQPVSSDFKGSNGLIYKIADGQASDSASIELETTGHPSISGKSSYGVTDLVVGMTLNGIAITSFTGNKQVNFASAQPEIADHENLIFENGGTIVEFSEMNVVVAPTLVTTTATTNATSTLTAVSGSSLFGLKTHNTAAYKSKLIGGFFNKTDLDTDTVLNSFNPANGLAEFSVAQNFDADQKLEFDTSQTATITAKGRVINYGSLNATIRLELDNILKLGTS